MYVIVSVCAVKSMFVCVCISVIGEVHMYYIFMLLKH